MVYHLILGKEATIQHITPSGPDEIGGLISNHAGLERRGGNGDKEARGGKLLPALLHKGEEVPKVFSGFPSSLNTS